MKRIATALTVVCLTFFLSGCGKSQPSGGGESADTKVDTTPPSVSLGSGSSDSDDGSTNPFEDEDEGNTSPTDNPTPTTNQNPKVEGKPPAKKTILVGEKPSLEETKK